MIALLLLAVSAASPAEGLARAAARVADDDDRFEVISELEVQDAVEWEAQRQSCGSDGESCAAQLAGAFDARYVLFLRLYSLGGQRHLAFTLTDLGDGHVIARDDEAGDDDALVAAVATVVPRQLRLIDGTERTRLFVSRVIDDSAEVVAGPDTGLVVAGSAVGIVGLVAGVVGGLVVASSLSVLNNPDSTGGAKDAAQQGLILGGGALVAGVVVAGAGVTLVVVGLP